MKSSEYVTAGEAAELLSISLPTLYAYVSRGLLRSEATSSSKRTRRYHRVDVEQLKRRREQQRHPETISATALHWGDPVLDSELTLIRDGELFYRGHNVLDLVEQHSMEEVAALLWTAKTAAASSVFTTDRVRPLVDRSLLQQLPQLTNLETFQLILPLAVAGDVRAFDLRPAAIRRTGAHILTSFVSAVTGQPFDTTTIAQTLQRAWAPDAPDAERLINSALILCADHELNVSSFTVRCVASAGATLYAAIGAGLGALSGVKHGGQTERVEAFLREIQQGGDVRRAIGDRLRRGESLPGFGHTLYPNGDPRGRALLALVATTYPDAPHAALVTAVVDEVQMVIGEYPTLDFALVTLAQALKLPPGGALTLFALGRTVGWVGHALEQYASDQMIRPRARYVGPLPSSEN